jgi:hypothetical protein
LISPSTTKAKSCLLFFYHMFGADVGELRVFIFIYVVIYLFLFIYMQVSWHHVIRVNVHET